MRKTVVAGMTALLSGCSLAPAYLPPATPIPAQYAATPMAVASGAAACHDPAGWNIASAIAAVAFPEGSASALPLPAPCCANRICSFSMKLPARSMR